MKHFLILTTILFLTACNQKQAPQPITQQPTAPQPIDTSGAKPYPVKIIVVKEVDTVYGYAVAKAVMNEKTLQAETRVIKYLNENMDTFKPGTRIVDIIKR